MDLLSLISVFYEMNRLAALRPGLRPGSSFGSLSLAARNSLLTLISDLDLPVRVSHCLITSACVGSIPFSRLNAEAAWISSREVLVVGALNFARWSAPAKSWKNRRFR